MASLTGRRIGELAEARCQLTVRVVLIAAAAIAGVLKPLTATAQSYEMLHGFSVEAGSPSSLLLASDGRMYGTTRSGGRFGLGSIFVLTANETGFDIATLWEFSGPDGMDPFKGLVQDSDGSLYGTTSGGGNGYGTVFRIDDSGLLTTLHRFVYSDGAFPMGALVRGNDGRFYGTTPSGGNGAGTVFRIDRAGSLTTLHSFTGDDGLVPEAGLVYGRDGSFYGTTSQGGATSCGGGCGTVFRIDGSGSFTTLHRFANSDGNEPKAALIQGMDGSFYGTTQSGGAAGCGAPCANNPSGYGTVFRIDSFGGFTTLHTFNGSDGASPVAELLQGSDGSLYGTTRGGIDRPGQSTTKYGTIFRLDPSGVLTTRHIFSVSDGSVPVAGLVDRGDGSLYGTTSRGGPADGGTVFRIDAGDVLLTLQTFANKDGWSPRARLALGSDASLYGTTLQGGANGGGTIFRINASGPLSTLYEFGIERPEVYAGLIQGTDGSFYGTTSRGGDGYGTVFRIDSSGTLTTLHVFTGDDGKEPVSSSSKGATVGFTAPHRERRSSLIVSGR